MESEGVKQARPNGVTCQAGGDRQRVEYASTCLALWPYLTIPHSEPFHRILPSQSYRYLSLSLFLSPGLPDRSSVYTPTEVPYFTGKTVCHQGEGAGASSYLCKLDPRTHTYKA